MNETCLGEGNALAMVRELQAEINALSILLNQQVQQIQQMQRSLNEIVQLELDPLPIIIPAADFVITPQESYIFVNVENATAGDIVRMTSTSYPEWTARVQGLAQNANITLDDAELRHTSVQVTVQDSLAGRILPGALTT